MFSNCAGSTVYILRQLFSTYVHLLSTKVDYCWADLYTNADAPIDMRCHYALAKLKQSVRLAMGEAIICGEQIDSSYCQTTRVDIISSIINTIL